MEDRIMCTELRELFEQMSPEMVKHKVARMAELRGKNPTCLRSIAQEAIDELKFRANRNDGYNAQGCCDKLSELADSIIEYASPEAILREYDVINQ